MTLRVNSEIGRLRRVLVHRPGPEIDSMVPEMMNELLFDDILFGEEAQAEHDTFRLVLERAGVEVLEAEDLLADVLEGDALRVDTIARLAHRYGLRRSAVRRLEDCSPARLATAMIAGLRSLDEAEERQRRFFAMRPVPNYFFQRDPQFVVGNRAIIASMATEAREREPMLARLIFQYHPELAGGAPPDLLERPAFGGPDHDPEAMLPTVEGGDVLVANDQVVLVGLSERTNRRGIEELAEKLQGGHSPFRYLVVIELPSQRSFMHLDTVLTFIDRGTCLAHLPVTEPGRAQSAHASVVDLDAEHLAFRLCDSVAQALAEVGIDAEMVPCGGEDRIDQEREQWTDGANAFAVEPGVILLYQRNRRTAEELARRGWRVLTEQEVLDGAPVMGRGRTAVTFLGNELSRARGGPRCMTMPLEREDP
jgi:arginine deiminase